MSVEEPTEVIPKDFSEEVIEFDDESDLQINTEDDDITENNITIDEFITDEPTDELTQTATNIHFDEVNNKRYSAILLAKSFPQKQIHYISLKISFHSPIGGNDIYVFEEQKGLFGAEFEEKEELTGDSESLPDIEDVFKSNYNKYTGVDWSSTEVSTDQSEYIEILPVSATERTVIKKHLRDLQVLDSRLDEAVQQMVSILIPVTDIINIWKMRSMKHFQIMFRESWLSKEKIKEGLQILGNIVTLIESHNNTLLPTLSNQFYLAIAHTEKYAQPLIFTDVNSVRHRMRLLEEKFEIDHSGSKMEIVSGEERIRVDEDHLLHPLDCKYLSLKCNISPLDKNSAEYQLLHEYFVTTGLPNYTVVNIFRCRRQSEVDTQLEGNTRLLWHGSSPGNLCGILREGMRQIRPGIGMFLADCAAKSLGYSQPYNRTSFLFLCDVALGENLVNIKSYNSLGLQHHDVVKFVGSVNLIDPKIYICESGSEVHIGVPNCECKDNSFNEYVVFNEKKIHLAYLVQILSP